MQASLLRPGDHVLGFQDTVRAQAVRMRYERKGWQFGLAPNPERVAVMSPSGNWYWSGERKGECTCPARLYCKHLVAVNDCAGVKALREALERWP